MNLLQTLYSEQEEVLTKYCYEIFASGAETEEFSYRLDRLIGWVWVKAVGYKGEIFELTGTGYSKADWLKDGMRIDTSKDPLDELKEFEN